MATDMLVSMGQHLTGGNNFSISLSTDSKEDTNQLHEALSAGGKVNMTMQDTFWGSYFGMMTDPFGIKWMVSYDETYQ